MRIKIFSILASGLLALSSIAFAGGHKKDSDPIDAFFNQIPGEFSSDVSLASDYAFRGVSQTGASPAIQGSFGYSLGLQDQFKSPIPINLYTSVWGSNVNFGSTDDSQIEMNLTPGINTEINGVSIDFYTIWYIYPDTSGSGNDYVEYAGGLGYDFGFASLGISYTYSPDYTVNAGEFHYFGASVSVPLPYKFTLDGTVGTGSFEREAGVDFTDWSIALSRDIRGFTLSGKYVANDMNDTDDCGGVGNCDTRGIFSISKSF